MERIPYNKRGRGGMDARHDRSLSRSSREAPPYTHPDPYRNTMDQGYPPPAPGPGYNNYPPPRDDMRGGRRPPMADRGPRPAIIDASGPPTDTAKHAK